MTGGKATAALLTPRGRGAVATIRYVGPPALLDRYFTAGNGRMVAAQPLGRIVFGFWGAKDNSSGDDAATAREELVLCRTGEEEVEIHCHGGDAATRRILNDLSQLDCIELDWFDQQRVRDGLFATECADALTRALTERTALLLLEQQGVLRRRLEELRELHWSPRDLTPQRAALDELLRWSRFGLHLTKPWSVVLAGRPNVGKSSLINALVGYTRSVVFDEPGTTRDVVTAETAFDGWPVQLSDTAGLRREAEELEAAGIVRARETFAAADCRVLVFDASQPPHPDDQQLMHDWPDALCVASKSDLPDAWGEMLPPHALRVSATTGTGLEELITGIVRVIVPETPPAGTALPITPRQVALLEAAREAVHRADEAAFRAALKDLLSADLD